MEEGLWKAKRRKERKIHQRRTRRAQEGELLQMDGSYHKWFEERGKKCCLILFVDDATSKIKYGKFCQAETTQEYMEGLKTYIEKNGKPQALYTDRHSSFRVSREEVKKGKGITQLGRALKELGIELICASSPQAKGRVERANGTLQNRLVKEMRLRKIRTKKEGNKYLEEFIEKYNQKFAVAPAQKGDVHRKNRENLEEILSIKEEKRLSKNLMFQHQNKQYLIETKTPNRLMYKRVELVKPYGKEAIVKYQGRRLEYKVWEEGKEEGPPVMDAKKLEVKWKEKKEPKRPKRHPWRQPAR